MQNLLHSFSSLLSNDNLHHHLVPVKSLIWREKKNNSESNNFLKTWVQNTTLKAKEFWLQSKWLYKLQAAKWTDCLAKLNFPTMEYHGFAGAEGWAT